ncbi:Nif3-like dinuclear metal center hexameric protein [Acetobacterium sp. UBA5834]|jgi:dinuclear metal center YbgI/SA1388 family protein|uniref:Nif3-like dinuclear metal center hexameric protein n=1 Tax=Acetobacterium sp. UBA5834 TaxID=1945907 RepID=UPI00257FDE51|nr:Nif3-like dinuclear metal center hexameric protein [Acetobacterium sp. UBA5834]
MSVKLNQIIQTIEALAPERLAESWDNVGLQVGSRQQCINRILLTLDVTADVVDEAVVKKADLIIAHHPFIFNGLKTVSCDGEKGQMIAQLIINDVAVYVAHTNLDKAAKGLNHYLAEIIGLEKIKTLEPSNPTRYYKLVVFTPVEASHKIIEVLGKNGAGAIGDYDYCTYRSSGTGTFRPKEGAKPFIGAVDKMTSVSEDRIEAIVAAPELKNLIAALKRNHPYEAMAYDVIPLENGDLMNENGLGKIGILSQPIGAVDFITEIKKRLDLPTLRGAGKVPEIVRRVAICSGAGADMIGLAKAKRADVLITGDLKHHDGQRALENNIWVLDAGHYGTEKWVTDCLKQMLTAGLEDACPEMIVAESSRDFIVNY